MNQILDCFSKFYTNVDATKNSQTCAEEYCVYNNFVRVPLLLVICSNKMIFYYYMYRWTTLFYSWSPKLLFKILISISKKSHNGSYNKWLCTPQHVDFITLATTSHLSNRLAAILVWHATVISLYNTVLIPSYLTSIVIIIRLPYFIVSNK